MNLPSKVQIVEQLNARKNRGKPRSKRFRDKEKVDLDIASKRGIVDILLNQ